MKFIDVMADKEFIEGEDYHLIDGRVVFSEKYLRERGSCCGNDCQFCCYTERVKGNKELKS